MMKGVAVLMAVHAAVAHHSAIPAGYGALICACEAIRRKALDMVMPAGGEAPFRIGLWVGRPHDADRTDDALEAIKQARGNQFVGGGYRHTLPTYGLTLVR